MSPYTVSEGQIIIFWSQQNTSLKATQIGPKSWSLLVMLCDFSGDSSSHITEYLA